METESGAEYSSLEYAEIRHDRKENHFRDPTKKPGRQGGASEPGQEGESPEWTIPI
jgi:hypothetical protein